MPAFAYRALESSGTVTADSLRAARDVLRGRGLTVSDVREVKTARAAGRRATTTKRFQLQRFARELATLLGVGVPVLEALEVMGRQSSGRGLAVIDGLCEQLRRGRGLGEAMREPPASEVFDDVSIQMVEAGEQSGRLETVLDRLADFQARRDALRGKLLTAMIYPGFVAIVAVGVGVFLMTAVVPNILKPLEQQGRTLPWITRVVKTISDVMLNQGIFILLGLAVVIAVATVLLRKEAGREWWHRTQLRLPVVGPLLRQQAVGHMAVVMGTLLESGIDFGRACLITARSSPQRVVAGALRAGHEAVVQGRDVAEAIEGTGEFPPLVVQAFSVGQRSGKMEVVLARVAVTCEAEVTRSTARLTALLEPVMICLIGVMVGAIALATILPILEASDAF